VCGTARWHGGLFGPVRYDLDMDVPCLDIWLSTWAGTARPDLLTGRVILFGPGQIEFGS
jgi:hypothetical protein